LCSQFPLLIGYLIAHRIEFKFDTICDGFAIPANHRFL